MVELKRSFYYENPSEEDLEILQKIREWHSQDIGTSMVHWPSMHGEIMIYVNAAGRFTYNYKLDHTGPEYERLKKAKDIEEFLSEFPNLLATYISLTCKLGELW